MSTRNHNLHPALIALGLGAIGIFDALAGGLPQRYAVIDMGRGVRPIAVNDQTVVLTPSFLWKDGERILVPDPDGRTDRTLHGINNAGHVLGQAQYDPFLWDGTSSEWVKPTLPSGVEIRAEALHLNDEGTITCRVSYEEIRYTLNAAIVNAGKLVDLGRLGGRESSPNAINNHGQVVGWSEYLDGGQVRGQHAFYWGRACIQGVCVSQMTDLGEGEATDLNNREPVPEAVGRLEEEWVVWRWNEGTSRWGHEVLPGLGGSVFEVKAINDHGRIAGCAWTSLLPAQQHELHGVVWDRGVAVDLHRLLRPEDANWEPRRPEDINNRDEIVGYGFLNGQEHGFLLVPAGELLITGFVADGQDLRIRFTDTGTGASGYRLEVSALGIGSEWVEWPEAATIAAIGDGEFEAVVAIEEEISRLFYRIVTVP